MELGWRVKDNSIELGHGKPRLTSKEEQLRGNVALGHGDRTEEGASPVWGSRPCLQSALGLRIRIFQSLLLNPVKPLGNRKTFESVKTTRK